MLPGAPTEGERPTNQPKGEGGRHTYLCVCVGYLVVSLQLNLHNRQLTCLHPEKIHGIESSMSLIHCLRPTISEVKPETSPLAYAGIHHVPERRALRAMAT